MLIGRAGITPTIQSGLEFISSKGITYDYRGPISRRTLFSWEVKLVSAGPVNRVNGWIGAKAW